MLLSHNKTHYNLNEANLSWELQKLSLAKIVGDSFPSG